MNTPRPHTVLFVASLLVIFGLTGCGDGGGSSKPKPQSAAAVADAPATAPATVPEPTVPTPSQPVPTPEQPIAIVADVIGSATVQWAAPQANTDGSSLQNLAGFTIVYGTSANDLSKSIRIDNPSIDQYVVEQLPAGKYYFGVKAHDSTGAESALSNLMTKVIG